ncbi:MAG: hypothetical protein U5K31_09755 [Balneolaceae bacterium]|nr:hypothetical protein [Balneolaceae bacterium]
MNPRIPCITLLLFTLALGACDVTSNPESEESDDVRITNDESELSQRLALRDDTVAVDTTDSGSPDDVLHKGRKNKDFNLSLVAEIDAPSAEGIEVQATMVSILGNSPRAAASYNLRGSGYAGAVDVIQLPSGNSGRLRIRSGVEFSDADANAVYVNSNRAWVAHASDNPGLVEEGDYAAVRQFAFNGFNISEESLNGVSLPGFAATRVTEYDNRMYVVSGSNAGLSVYNLDLSERLDYLEIDDARWVDVNDRWVVVLSGGSQGTIRKYSRQSLELQASYSFPGAGTPGAKNTVEIVGDLALIAAGDEGAHFMNLVNGEIIDTIPVPDAEELGLSPDVVTTNAVSADGEYVFISNGEAGVYVARADESLNDFEGENGEELDVGMVGQLQFDDLQSANHVSYRHNYLIVAAGLGGVKAVRLDREEEDDE